MKLLETDWAVFIACLEAWRRVPPAARLDFLTQAQPPFEATAAPDALPFLLDAGILQGAQGRSSFRLAEPMRSFARVLRALHRYPLFDATRPVGLPQYLADHFSHEERASLGGGDPGVAAETLGSRAWLDGFLAAPDLVAWEREHQGTGAASYFATPATAEPARELVRALARRGRAVEMAELGSMEVFQTLDPDRRRERLAAAVGGAIRYCLLFPALRPKDWEPLLGVWPGLGRVRRRKVEPLPVVTPRERFHAPILIHDMGAVLVECSGSPVAVRRSDLGMPARTVERLGRHLYPLPPWCEPFLAKTATRRLRAAQLFLHSLGYVAVRRGDGADTRMRVTEGGRAWLSLPVAQKIRAVLRHLEAAPSPEQRIELLPSPPKLLLLSGRLDLREAVRDVFRRLEVGRHVEYRPYLRIVLERSNPYLELRRKGLRMSVRGLDGYREPTKSELEDQWERLVERFLAQRLLVLEGVELGLTAEHRLSFALTEVGRCLLGLAKDFDYPAEAEARVVLQPNFEVVFLAANAEAEAGIGRFAERVGREVGTLFRVTKQSVLRAASTGLDAQGLLDSLREHVAGPLPPNVETEIRGWLGQCRRVRLENALLIRLPDAETTARAVSAGGKLVRLVSDTVLEVVEPRRRVSLERRLAEEGIFLE